MSDQEYKMLIAVNGVEGNAFLVRLVQKGDQYGLDLCLTHDKDEPMVEFYDTRYPHTPLGQFVSRYYVSTLLEDYTPRGLDLHGGVPSWTVTERGITMLINRIREVYDC